MTQRILGVLFLALVLVSLAMTTACETMGHATGDVVQAGEEGKEDFKKGYEEGRSD